MGHYTVLSGLRDALKSTQASAIAATWAVTSGLTGLAKRIEIKRLREADLLLGL